MIETYKDLKEYLNADSKNYQFQNRGYFRNLYTSLLSNPISDQYYIWKYIKTLRFVEYYNNNLGIRNKLLKLYYLWKLRKISYKTGFQIPPNTCGRGLTIWHWGNIIINQNVRIGCNCTLYPDVLIGWKGSHEQGCAIIGDNVFIGSGTKIIGAVKIGNNVILGQNLVITKDIPDDSIVVSNSAYRFL